MNSTRRQLMPHVWAHRDRYFATAEVRGAGADATALVCISRWSPRNDWQVIRVEVRDVDAARANRIAAPTQRIERKPKAAHPGPRLVTMVWFPSEEELVQLRPLSLRVIKTLGPEIRAVVRNHILAYDLVEHPEDSSQEHVVALTVRRYLQLVNVGETSAAACIAESRQVPVRTIHNRLRLARERGLLPTAGQGARTADEPVSAATPVKELLYDVISPALERPRSRRGARNSDTKGRPVPVSRPRGRAAIRP